MPPNVKQIGSADWNRWFQSLDPEEKVVVLIQTWGMMEVAKRGLYDRILGEGATKEFDEEMEVAFDRTCREARLDPRDVKSELNSVVEALTDDLEGVYDDIEQ